MWSYMTAWTYFEVGMDVRVVLSPGVDAYSREEKHHVLFAVMKRIKHKENTYVLVTGYYLQV